MALGRFPAAFHLRRNRSLNGTRIVRLWLRLWRQHVNGFPDERRRDHDAVVQRLVCELRQSRVVLLDDESQDALIEAEVHLAFEHPIGVAEIHRPAAVTGIYEQVEEGLYERSGGRKCVC
jgi:hypothetical protein